MRKRSDFSGVKRLFAISTHFSGSTILRSAILCKTFFNLVSLTFWTSSPALAFISRSLGHSFVMTRSRARYHKFTKYCTLEERNKISFR
ncbi:TPA: hypothetical protein DCZ39_03175 [Patescibacteria group bacterium]|nr:hypothetical protein [Candidatus Gracilibacteria bacterium]